MPNVPEPANIIMVGAGRVAWHLAPALTAGGYSIKAVWSRSLPNAQALAKEVNSVAVEALDFTQLRNALVIISVTDGALPQVVENIKVSENNLVVHTSGSVGMEVLAPLGERIGVFYPLQTFSKEKKVDWQTVPICLEANTAADEGFLKKLAGKLSNKVLTVSSAERSRLHVAAVFACNFSNHMLNIAGKLLQSHSLPTDLLNPLVKETLEKALEISPAAAQTGPARRGDEAVLQKHLHLLADTPGWQDIYKILSQDIQRLAEQS